MRESTAEALLIFAVAFQILTFALCLPMKTPARQVAAAPTAAVLTAQ